MARAKFTIKNEHDAIDAQSWIRNQYKGFNFLYENSRQSIDAENEFNNIGWHDFIAINDWCEKHLKKDDWNKLKGAIRSKRLRSKRAYGNAQMIIRVDVSSNAHTILKSLAKHHGVTLSEVIILYMEKAWLDLPMDE